jgi:Zn-dependent protease
MEILFLIIILLFSIVIHEVAHGAMAYHLGDPTAKYAGRITLNPIKHIDPIGSILVPLFLVIVRSPFLFGWAKPVPVNPYNFRDRKYGSAKAAMAGPGANFLVALFFGLPLRLFPDLIEIPGLFLMSSSIVFVNILLAIFNLLPIPPLDGSHILFAFLPYHATQIKTFLTQFGFLILIGFIFLGGFRLISPLILTVFHLITGQPLI